MLRASAKATNNKDLNLFAVTKNDQASSGVRGGEALLAFAEAAVTRSERLPDVREALKEALGEQGLIEAAAVIGNFERMTRIADATGIPLDERNIEFTREVREILELGRFTSARLPSRSRHSS